MHGKVKYYFESLRLERWPRSLAIILGFVAAIVIEPSLLDAQPIHISGFLLVLSFFLTLLISTSNYIINEIADAPSDAHHPAKKDRPLVKKIISVKILLVLWLIMVIIAFAGGKLFFNKNFVLSLAALLMAGLLYNIPPVRVKDIPFLDSTLESANNPIRFLTGWFVLTSTFPPASLLISWWAFGNFLMVGKRVAEKKFLSPEESAGYRLSLKKYTITSLIAFMILNSIIFILTFSLFAIETKMYTLLISVPFILIYLGMFMKKSVQDRDGAEEPEKLLKDPYFAFY
ncbi:MAG: UbiA family prenyltransferase, partial [Candidatus Aminicenantes bacterium]|nr:UbiA family prenyltransferase [Candidatus Aminicenantes bacterium]